MILPPYPAPLTVLEPVHISKGDDPKKAIEVLTHKIDQVTRLVHEYVRYQEPLSECITTLRKIHEQEFADVSEALKTSREQIQELKNTVITLQ